MVERDTQLATYKKTGDQVGVSFHPLLLAASPRYRPRSPLVSPHRPRPPGRTQLAAAPPHYPTDRLAPVPSVVARLGALTPREHMIDARVTARAFPGAARGVPAHPDGKPVARAGSDAALPVARLLAGLRNANGREDAVDAHHDGSLGTLEGRRRARLARRGVGIGGRPPTRLSRAASRPRSNPAILT